MPVEFMVSVSDVSLFVLQEGQGQDVVVLHGGPDWDHSYLLPAVIPLAETHRITLYDHRGCGRSTRFGTPEAYDLDQAVDDLASLLTELNLNRPVLLGFSWGGRVALRFVQRYPDRCKGLILASSTAYTDFQDDLKSVPGYLERTAALEEEMAALPLHDLNPAETTRQFALLKAPLGVHNPALVPELLTLLNRICWSGEWWTALKAGRLAGIQHPDYAQVLQDARLPTLILHGRYDLSFPVHVARRLHAAYPQATLEELNGGHFCFLEDSEGWNRALQSFLKTLA